MFTDEQRKNLFRFRVFYIIALSLVALLSLSAHFLIYTKLRGLEADSRLINIAGRQRMLSQKITKAALRVSFAANEDLEKSALQELHSALSLWQRSHQGLLNGDEEMQLSPIMNPDILQQMQDIEEHYQPILNSGLAIVGLESRTKQAELLEQYINLIINHESLFLEKMDRIVFAIDQQSKIDVDQLMTMKKILLSLVLLILLSEVFLIFEPIYGRLRQLIILHNEKNEELASLADSLEQRVQQRTLELEVVNERLRSRDKRLRSLFETAYDAILLFDGHKIVDANHAATRIFGVSDVSELINRDPIKDFSPLLQANGQPSVEVAGQYIEKAVMQGKVHFDWSHKRIDGTEFIAEVSLTNIERHNDKLVMMAVIRDVSVRRQTEQAMQEAKSKAETASKMKSMFLANMSHEIRTPLNAVIGFAQLLSNDPSLQPASRRQVDTILSSGRHLLGLINDILDMSKIEAGKMEVNKTGFELEKLVKDVHSMLTQKARNKGLEFSVDLPVNATISTDEQKVRQVMINLLGNAIKFTEQGEVVLQVMLQLDQADATAQLKVTVSDTGSGISTEDLESLFLPFEQTRAGIESKGGTGLGLAISRSYAELLGGSLSADSTEGRGSRFYFSIPVEVESLADAKHSQSGFAAAETKNDQHDNDLPTIEAIKGLPQAWLVKMEDAAVGGDVDSLTECIDEIAATQPALSAVLQGYAQCFDYGALVQMVKTARAQA